MLALRMDSGISDLACGSGDIAGVAFRIYGELWRSECMLLA